MHSINYGYIIVHAAISYRDVIRSAELCFVCNTVVPTHLPVQTTSSADVMLESYTHMTMLPIFVSGVGSHMSYQRTPQAETLSTLIT